MPRTRVLLVAALLGASTVAPAEPKFGPASIDNGAVLYVLTGSLAIDLEVHGELPPTTWLADVAVCMVGSFSL